MHTFITLLVFCISVNSARQLKRLYALVHVIDLSYYLPHILPILCCNAYIFQIGLVVSWNFLVKFLRLRLNCL